MAARPLRTEDYYGLEPGTRIPSPRRSGSSGGRHYHQTHAADAPLPSSVPHAMSRGSGSSHAFRTAEPSRRPRHRPGGNRRHRPRRRTQSRHPALHHLEHTSQPIPTNADGLPKVHDLVVLQPSSSSHASAIFWWKAAAIGVLVLFGAAAVTAFVLTSLYAPAALPYVSLAIALLTFHPTLGITGLSTRLEENTKKHIPDQREDAYVEERLKEWGNSSLNQVLTEHASPIADHMLRNLELPDHPDLKTLFARSLYHEMQEGKFKTIYRKAKKEIHDLEKMLAPIERKIKQALREARVDLLELCTTRKGLEYLLQKQKIRRNDALENMANAHGSQGLYLYLIMRPINRIPESSHLTPLNFLRPAVLQDTRNDIPYKHRNFCRLPNGRHLTYHNFLKTTPINLSSLIDRALNVHIEKAARRATQPAAATRV